MATISLTTPAPTLFTQHTTITTEPGSPSREWGAGQTLGRITRLSAEEETRIAQKLKDMQHEILDCGLNELLQRLASDEKVDLEQLMIWFQDFDASDDKGIALSIGMLKLRILGPLFNGDDPERLIPLDELCDQLLINLGQDPDLILDETKKALITYKKILTKQAVHTRISSVFNRAVTSVIQEADSMIGAQIIQKQTELLEATALLAEGESLIQTATDSVNNLATEVLTQHSHIAQAHATSLQNRSRLTALLDSAKKTIEKDI